MRRRSAAARPAVVQDEELPPVDSPAAHALITAAYRDAYAGIDHHAVFVLLCRYAGIKPAEASRDGLDPLALADPGEGPGPIARAFQRVGQDATRDRLDHELTRD